MPTEAPASEAFCITCGGPDPVADGECADCIREGMDVVRGPDEPVDIERCAHCGAIPVRDTWDQPTTLLEAVEQSAIGAIRVPEGLKDLEIGVRVQERDPKDYVVEVQVAGVYRSVPVEGETPVRVRVKTVSCNACSKRHGGYYEAIVQVRTQGEEDVSDEQAGEIAQMIEEEVRRLGGLSGGQSYLLKAEARHGGYDYYFGAKPVAKAVARRISDRYGGKTTHSTTLAGQQDGQEMHRLTLAVRLPRVRLGAVIGFEDEVLQVYGRQGNRVLAHTVPEGEGRTIEDRNLERAVLLEPQLVDVVYAEEGEGQILDPDSYDAVNVRLPEGVSSGEQVHAVRYEGRWVVFDT